MTINGHITVRICNNVLPLSEAVVYRLKLKDGKVVDAETVSKGCYGDGSRNFIGKTIEDLSEWSSYDGTGSHPEEYHEVLLTGAWRSFVGASALVQVCTAEEKQLTELNLKTATVRVAAEMKFGLTIEPGSDLAQDLIFHAEAYRRARGGEPLSEGDAR